MSSSFSRPASEFLCSPSLASLDSGLDSLFAAAARAFSTRSCCAREVNGHLRGSLPPEKPEPSCDASTAPDDLGAAAAAASRLCSGAIMAAHRQS
eukprot:3002510-Prymnesium_polylepis.1